MAKNPLTRIAVIGAGRIALMHAAIIRNTGGAQLAGIVDRKGRYEQLRAAGLDGVRLYANADDAFADVDVDAVLIASSTPTHIGFIRAAVAAGKNVLCEKPVAFCAADIDALAKETARCKHIIQVAFNRRFDDDFLQLRARLQSGEVGNPIMIHITNHDPQCPPPSFAKTAGGMFADFNVHDFDMLRFLTGATIKNIHARGGAKVCQQQDGIDTTLLSMELAGGVFASVHCCRQSGRGYDQRVEILAQKGMLFLQNHNNNAIAIANNNGKTIANPPPDFAARYKNSYQTQLRAFITACQNNDDNKSGKPTTGDNDLTNGVNGDNDLITIAATLADAAEAIKTAEAAQQSLTTGKAITLP